MTWRTAGANFLRVLYLAFEIGFIVWLISYLAERGIVGVAQDFLLYTFLLWIAFGALILLKRRAERDHWHTWSINVLKVCYVVGYGFDCWFNSRFGTLAFLEFPPDRVWKIPLLGWAIHYRIEPFTARLQRHYLSAGRRGNEARLFCWLVHRIEPGHCL